MSGLRKSVRVSALVASIAMSLVASRPAQAQQDGGVLFQNVRIFDGKNGALSGPSNVLIRNNKIERISTAAITADAQVIAGDGRVLMPGLIDAHWHALLVRPTPAAVMASDVGYTNLLAAAEATATLMRGFTTIRDMGGPAFSLKRAIDEGLVVGPRIYPSGAMITITGGHGDFRQLSDLPRTIGGMLSRMERIGGAMVADSPDEVRVRAREQLMQGATQVKLTAGGGVASPFSPLDVSTFTEPELRAAVDAAENWGTYVAVHAYTSVAIQRSIAAGVKCIEHGHLMDDASARLMAEKGIWLSTQPFLDLSGASALGPAEQDKMRQVVAGTDRVYGFAKKYKLKTAFGTDVLFSKALADRQGAMLTALTRWYTPAEALIMATSTNAELLALSGLRNPYPGKLGVVEEGAFADLLLVDGNPIDNIKLIEDPAKNFLVIMKDGKVYKNLLGGDRNK
ncbi:amidohydrolase family protein [Bradyrhizobium elkanii]|uniref:Imidazolonepropionase-like amidohydrolase n=2 Tax=Bradyrhizobium elkanii TaxID=29448 RepID=A0ABV4F3D1_BRAEL|nr:amidohydrolase family protein [Bradyrhizobium elkanii]MBP2434945.1 imidazolonepropionase-like amidohydrolase [Bradyrhizobium elkanii]MCP1749517.1 imidazolonepropionase-like amidohydrolase [Bradyrhizobium elkanii]MCP1984089.1 imidazolonepropionase-like amidohydrolase [Bradyrhizobium elkanii]MCS3890189.1 imidazolonepropionase-like amidohydrolase [Bradyrhizobium elkanii]MCS4220213.1 imidazolonepropionase-like amidohydrolase [Bradyrhizobium elkanii]